MSLDHDFFLVAAAEHTPAEHDRFINGPNAVRLHDDLVRYMDDSFQWIPTSNPALSSEPGRGLNLYGATVIDGQGADVAERVFHAWVELFVLGPPVLRLTGSYSWGEGSDPELGRYERLEFPRDEVVTRLRQLADWCRKAADSGGAHYLLHIGI